MGKFETIETFVAIVQRGGISPAAKQLGLAKSAISRRLQELESMLGAQLIYRSTRSFSLTREGALFYEKCLRIFDDLKEAELCISKNQNVLSGTLRVTAPMSFGILQMAPLVAEFLKIHKELKLELDLNDRMVDIVGEGFDVGIRISTFDDSALIGRKISAIVHLAVASPAYLKRMGMPRTPADLKDHRGLVYSNIDPQVYWQFNLGKAGGKIDVSKIFCPLTVNNGDALREAAISGLGIAVLPSFIVEKAIAEGKLKIILQHYQRPPIYLYAIYSSKKHTSAKVSVFVDFLRRHFSGDHLAAN